MALNATADSKVRLTLSIGDSTYTLADATLGALIRAFIAFNAGLWRKQGIVGLLTKAFLLVAATTVALGVFWTANWGYYQATGDTPAVRVGAPSIALSPGSAFDPLAFCRAAKTVEPGPPAPGVIGITRVAQLGLEQVVWVDDGKTGTAAHYWWDNGAQQYEPIEITKAAAECLRTVKR